MDDNLRRLENKSIFIIREVKKQFKHPAILWSMGKDSSLILELTKKAFFGEIPFPVVHLDTGFKFKKMYDFRDKMAKKLGLNLIVHKNLEATAKPENKLKCCTERKTEALKQVVKKYGFDALLVGIRRDEHHIREKERIMSPRDKDFMWHLVREKKPEEKGDSPFESMQEVELDGWGLYATEFKDANHVRVHPIINWNEIDVWRYTKETKIPVVPLYFAKRNLRYRSLGCMPCTKPVPSKANNINKIIKELETTKVKERSGRAQDKEEAEAMRRLRAMGYL